MAESEMEQRASAFRSRLFTVLGSSLMLAVACGETGADDPGAAGSAGNPTGGSAGSVASGGTAGAAGATSGGFGGTGGSGYDANEEPYNRSCFDSNEIDALCASDPDGGLAPWTCWGESGSWQVDGGMDCPERIVNSTGCSSYSQGTLSNSECCFIYSPGAAGCGRPLLVSGEARRAEVAARSDWTAPLGASALELPAEVRRFLAGAWLADARLEHASIAAFARFSLELLGLAAPADLVRDAQRAASDEVEHAKLCFALASRYAGSELGPAALNVDGILGPVSLAGAATRAVLEGCVGETLAAFVAAEQAQRASDPSVKAALARIADDERFHAELSFRFVAWAVSHGGEDVRSAVARAFHDAIAGLRRRAPAPDAGIALGSLHAHGRLGAAEQHEVELCALREIVEPAARWFGSRSSAQRRRVTPRTTT